MTIRLDVDDEPEGLVTLRVGVTLSEAGETFELGPRIVHEVDARTLFDHIVDHEPDLPEGDVFPRWELTLWDETELARWPLDIAAIPAELADVLLDGELDELLAAATHDCSVHGA